MRNFFKTLGIIAMVAVITFGFAACDNGGDDSSNDPALPGSITITVNGTTVTTADVGTTLTANYSGTETVTYQWKKDGVNVGTASTTNPNTYTPTQAGSYTVTVSAAGFQSKTSAAVTITQAANPGGDDPCECTGDCDCDNNGECTECATPNTYTVTYYGNENTVGDAPLQTTHSYGDTVTVANQNTLVRAGCTFNSWNTLANGGGTPYETDSTFTITANITLYAQWNDILLSNSNVTLLSIAGNVAGAQNVRSVPSSTNASTILKALQNSLVHIVKIDAESKWLVVEYERDKIAYMAYANATSAVLTSRVGKALANKVVYTATTATDIYRVGVVEEDYFVLIIEKTGNWFKILYDGTETGYITHTNIVIPQGVLTQVTNNPKWYNYPGSRGPEAYNQIINQFNVGQNTWDSNGIYTSTTYNSRYNQTRDSSGVLTQAYSNIYNWDVMTAMRVHFPHWRAASNPSLIYLPLFGEAYSSIIGKGFGEMNENSIYDWITAYGKDYGWTEVDATIAQNRANNGFPTVTVWKNQSGFSGHAQVVRPEGNGYVYSTANSCVVSQAGATNFNYGNVRTAYPDGIPPVADQTYPLRYYTRDIDTVNGGSDFQPELKNAIDPNDPGYTAVVWE